MLTRFFKRLCALLCLPALCFALALPVFAQDEHPAPGRVLFITSYSYAWDTVPQQLQGIQEALGDRASLTVRGMDTKSVSDEESLRLFYEQTEHLLRTAEPFDAVIVGDDDALKFVTDHRDTLFAGLPVVFEGINKLDAAQAAAADGLTTGVVEKLDYTANMELALRMTPGAKRVVAILDDTVTGEGERAQFYAQAENYPELEFTEINVSRMTADQLCLALTEVETDSILIYLIASADSSGQSYTNQQICTMIAAHAPVPCFRFVSAGIGQGVLGGYVVSHYESGRIAGQMALQILDGTDPAEIPVQTESPNRYLFDHAVIRKYDVDRGLLPDEAEFLNYQPTFWEEKGRTILITAAVVVALCGVLLHLLHLASVNKTNHILARKNLELADAIADADQANRAKTLFLSNVSHDLRTPVGAIVSTTGLARRDVNDPGKVWAALDRIETASRLLLGIINDVLDLSAIENEKIKLVRQPFRPEEVLQQLATIYRDQCAEKGLEFRLDTQALGDQTLVGDPLRLTQILMNLIANACKFTPAGGFVQVTAEQIGCRDGRVQLRFAVQDNGCGISHDAQQRMYEFFEQEDASHYGGSGLGLPIAKNLVELMQGSIRCQSEKGRGTTFTVELPFACAAPAGDGRFAGLRVLVAEDDRGVRAAVGDLLTSLGVPYDEADKDQAAGMLTAARAESRRYDLCILGWTRDDVHGLEVARRICQLFEGEPLQLLIAAQEATERVRRQAEAAGAGHFSARPVDADALLPVLEALADRARKRQATPLQADFGGKRVLLADNDPMAAEPLTELLQRWNLQVHWVQNGEQALEAFRCAMPGHYAAILLDIQMPVMDGYEAARAIRVTGHPQAKTIPLIAVTARAFADSITASRSAGMNAHVTMPDQQGLLEALHKHI